MGDRAGVCRHARDSFFPAESPGIAVESGELELRARRSLMPVSQYIPKTALVVDDSMLIRHTVCRFLEERGFLVDSATNGVEALIILEHFMPDLIITDLSIPRMGGEELVFRIRQIEVFANTPIVILAARTHASELPEHIVAGTSAVIYKNIQIEEQLSRTLVWLMANSDLAEHPGHGTGG